MRSSGERFSGFSPLPKSVRVKSKGRERTQSNCERNFSIPDDMPTYAYHCNECDKDFTLQMSVKEHDKDAVKCPDCNSKKVRHKLEPFFAKTSRKS